MSHDAALTSYSLFEDGDQLKLFDQTMLAENRLPDFHHEKRHFERGKQLIAGIDEAGRGPLAGPVVAAAVIVDPSHIPDGLNDSKKLPEKDRQNLFEEIVATGQVGWASVSAKRIDEINIRQSALLGMVNAVKNLPVEADHMLVDGRDVPMPLHDKATSLVKGDAISVSIAAASIVAKVIRDKMMEQASITYPNYGFESHKGYGSAKHIENINKYGACPLHRTSFSPLKERK